MDWFSTLSLVFGGCCSNAITLEQVTSLYPDVGTLITFAQFAIISLYGLPKHVYWTRCGPRFRPRRIPLTPYLIQVALFYVLSLLNNAAFAYHIPMAVHIIFRSGGLIISMLLGWLIAGKRYSLTQILSVLLVTAGVILTTLSASPSTKSDTKVSDLDPRTYATGIVILTLALVLSGFLGLVQDWTYRNHSGPDNQRPPWQESMFYLHFFALPMFIPLRSSLITQFASLTKGPLTPFEIHSSFPIPTAYLSLLVNTLTQLICIAGVHRLTTRVSSLTVTLVLVVRKAVSLILSILGVGLVKTINRPHANQTMMWLGAGLVLAGTIGYTIGSTGPQKPDKSKGEGKKE